MTSKCIETPPLLPGRAPGPAITWLTRLVAIGFSVLVVAGLITVYFFDPHHSSIYPVCPFHQLTGLECPGCGMLRGTYELLHGHLLTALHDNALLILTLPFLGWLAGRYLLRLARGRSTADIQLSPTWLWLWVCAMVVFTVLRNFPAFAWLSP